MLKSFLQDKEYALCISTHPQYSLCVEIQLLCVRTLGPGFFSYYCYIGVLHALEDARCLNPTHVSGSSAGSLVGGFLASGMTPIEMRDLVLGIRREDMWDIGGFMGLLRGQHFHNLLERHLPCRAIERCKLPFGTTAFDVLGMKTTLLQSGSLATAIRASCTFPLLFQPVWINWRPHIDGGIFDDCGMMALPGIPPSKLIVNIVSGFERGPTAEPPVHFADAILLSLVIENVPMVTPFSMTDRGPIAYR